LDTLDHVDAAKLVIFPIMLGFSVQYNWRFSCLE
jgi:hypothetical protein